MDDLLLMFRFQNDIDSNAMAVTHARDAVTFAKHWDSILDDQCVIARAIELEGRLVGYISCFPVDSRMNIGYWIDKSHWGKGIASQAVQDILLVTKARPVYAQAARSNGASIRVLKKCGFTITEYKHEPECQRYPACEVALLKLE